MHITTIKPEASESKKIISILPYGILLLYTTILMCMLAALTDIQSREHL